MKLAELIEEYENRLERAEELGTLAPLERIYASVLDDLRKLDGVPDGARYLSTSEAADRLGVKPATVATWASEGRFPGAFKTAEGRAGEWRIPASDLSGADPRAHRAEEEPGDRVRFDL